MRQVDLELDPSTLRLLSQLAIAYFDGEWTALRVKVRLSELLSGLWKDRWLKSPPKKPQAPRKKVRKRTHSSVYRILEAHQQRLKKEKRQLQLT